VILVTKSYVHFFLSIAALSTAEFLEIFAGALCTLLKGTATIFEESDMLNIRFTIEVNDFGMKGCFSLGKDYSQSSGPVIIAGHCRAN
jgi:hypothetical protein